MAIEKINICTDSGKIVEATAPVIISASRPTDIPAFYTKWFFNRLAKGYCAWYNPFNQQKMYVSFSKCKVIVFWTKNPKPIIPYLHILDEMGIHYYFQVTLNDYTKEGFEPNVPSVEKRIETFKNLSDTIGKEKVIWRFDPLPQPTHWMDGNRREHQQTDNIQRARRTGSERCQRNQGQRRSDSPHQRYLPDYRYPAGWYIHRFHEGDEHQSCRFY